MLRVQLTGVAFTIDDIADLWGVWGAPPERIPLKLLRFETIDVIYFFADFAFAIGRASGGFICRFCLVI